jgi:hypothetical protein
MIGPKSNTDIAIERVIYQAWPEIKHLRLIYFQKSSTIILLELLSLDILLNLPNYFS